MRFTAEIACTQTLFSFSLHLFQNIGELASARFFSPHYPLGLAINKSPAAYFIMCALEGN